MSHNRTGIDEAIAAWEAKGPTSLTVALLSDALYGARDEIERLHAELRTSREACLDEYEQLSRSHLVALDQRDSARADAAESRREVTQ